MLEQDVKRINRSLKLGEIQLGVKFTELDKIPFSSCRLNYMTYGGIPVGRIIEFSGSDGSGKTTTALDLVGQAQKKFKDKKVLFVDIEHTFDTEWATKLGVDIKKILYYDPDSSGAEDVFNIILELVGSGEISLCVLDSLGAMVSHAATEKNIGDKTYGGISMALTEFSKKITPILAKTGCSLIGINQIRDDLNSRFGGTTTTGGKNWRHSCSLRLDFRRGEYIDEKGTLLSSSTENPAGNLVKVHIMKSKVHRLDRRVGFYTLNYLTGIDYITDMVDTALKYGVINQTGAWYRIVDMKSGELLTRGKGNIVKFQGKARLVEELKTDKKLYNKILGWIEKVENEK